MDNPAIEGRSIMELHTSCFEVKKSLYLVTLLLLINYSDFSFADDVEYTHGMISGRAYNISAEERRELAEASGLIPLQNSGLKESESAKQQSIAVRSTQPKQSDNYLHNTTRVAAIQSQKEKSRQTTAYCVQQAKRLSSDGPSFAASFRACKEERRDTE